MDIWIISAILLITLYLLITEKISVDLTAIGIMVLLVVSRILTPREAISGFSNPAVITVGAMFVVSKGMMRTGGVEFLGRQVIKLAKGNFMVALTIILVSVAFASAFINNTPVVILFIPVVMAMCCEFGMSPSKFLIPVSYASILAGTCTLIGTSTNIIISDLSNDLGHGALSMFELSIVGLPIAVVGIVFLLFAAPRVLPELTNPVCHLLDSDHREYLAELRICTDSDLIGRSVADLFDSRYPSMVILEVINRSRIYHPGRDRITVQEDDMLLVKGSLNDLIEILHNEGVELPSSEKDLQLGAQKDAPIVVELIISPHSTLRGRKLANTDLAQDPEVHVIAVKRSQLHLTERQIHDVRLKTGDIILIWCSESKLGAIRAGTDCIVIEDVYEEIVHKRKAAWSIMNFIGMIGTATLGFADIMTCALTAAFLMIVTGCLQMRDAYRALQGDVLPIAVSNALGIGVDPKPFIIGICIGASACFATPMGYQTNLMVYGPGGYRFIDYLKLGIPLNIFVVLAGTLLIPLVWPF